VRRAVFSADGQSVLSCSDDGTVRIWRARDGQEIRRLDQGQAVWSIDYDPFTQTAISGSADGTVRLWDASPLTLDRLVGWIGENRYVAELTCAQREQYRVAPACLPNSAE
jgi:WD40 repeat protein